MLSEELSIYQKDEKYLVLNPHTPSWIVTNLTGIVALKLYCENNSFEKTAKNIYSQNKNISESSVLSFLRQAEAESLFSDKKIVHFHKPYFFYALYLNMTEDCNLHCTYCYAAARKEKTGNVLTIHDYKRILEQAKKIANNGKLEVCFTGGEPLLSENTILVAELCKQMGFNTKILTNATLINEKNVKKIVNVFDGFKISVDGSIAEYHDHYRGNGSYKKTVHAIELLKENNADVQVAMVVTKENKSDVQAMQKKWGERLTYQPLFPIGRAKGNSNVLTGEEYYEALCGDININPFSDIANIIKAHQENRTIHKCAMGDGEISISCTGDVYPCHLLHNDAFYLGNVHEQSFEEIYNSEKNNNFKFHTFECIEGCKDCDFKYLCGGACQARHFSETGTIDKAGDFCEYEKRGIIEGLIRSCEMIDF